MILRTQAGCMRGAEFLVEKRMGGRNLKVCMINNDGYNSNILWSSK